MTDHTLSDRLTRMRHILEIGAGRSCVDYPAVLRETAAALKSLAMDALRLEIEAADAVLARRLAVLQLHAAAPVDVRRAMEADPKIVLFPRGSARRGQRTEARS